MNTRVINIPTPHYEGLGITKMPAFYLGIEMLITPHTQVNKNKLNFAKYWSYEWGVLSCNIYWNQYLEIQLRGNGILSFNVLNFVSIWFTGSITNIKYKENVTKLPVQHRCKNSILSLLKTIPGIGGQNGHDDVGVYRWI